MPEGRTAVVTGGSRGIGRAVVQRLARDGVEVVFNYARSEQAAAEVLAAVRAEGGTAHALPLDLATAGAAEELMQRATELTGGLDVLVNNAAQAFRTAPLAETDEAVFDEIMTVNARTVFLTLRHAARHMRDDGRIVNISSLNTRRPAKNSAPYAASKGAMEQLTLVAAQELGARGITVNTVSPGATDTELLRGANPPESLEKVAGMTPLGRLGQPSDVADVVAFLCGPDARWITGQNILATGGLS
ncbi:glucose 1-dehydrogenase [Streptomyces sp. NA04227]|uniref:SDR family NAD(P)-dependent oxidoreductase n=1 Tax=Streptomyces sp. NA04227 TaxID=2742136 RepID=UPI001590BC4E|nr:glucose 1-dehydrogenase [Streptomyces sp. NA04227]QKW06414.1 glucose 1-dehydrogenase [Streptomyces sp. NA04227]